MVPPFGRSEDAGPWGVVSADALDYRGYMFNIWPRWLKVWPP